MGESVFGRRSALVLLACIALGSSLRAQDRLKTYPGYEQYTRIAAQRAGAVKSGQIMGRWSDDGAGFDYMIDIARYRFDAATGKVISAPPFAESAVV